MRCSRSTNDFNPRSPHGERQPGYIVPRNRYTISIHAPRTGSDGLSTSGQTSLKRFQSTLPARGATDAAAEVQAAFAISIHAPRTGSDRLRTWRWNIGRNFNPRSPHGERPEPAAATRGGTPFQSTLPARGATQGGGRQSQHHRISIHAPRTGSDRTEARQELDGAISIHAPRTGSDALRRTVTPPEQ